MRLIFTLIAAAASFLGSLFSQPASAIERVQLNIFMVKAIDAREGKVGNVPIVLVFDAESNREAQYLCQISPRGDNYALSIWREVRTILQAHET